MERTHTPMVVLADGARHVLPAALELIRQAGFAVVEADARPGVDPLEVIADADAVLALWYPMTEAVIRRLRRCRLIVRVGIGVDTVDLDAARHHGIPVSNVPDYCIDEVADHAFALALALARQLPALDRDLHRGQWTPARRQPIHRFATQTFATLGCGRIARAVLARARACGFQLAACDPYVADDVFAALGAHRLTLDEVFAEADILSLHAPLTAETRHLVSAARLARMKPTAILINTARGPLVDTRALAEALWADRLGAAGLDVFEQEPLETDHPLLACDNVLLTPHQAWYSEESSVDLHMLAAGEVIRALRGEPLRNSVNGLGAPAAAREETGHAHHPL